MGLLQTPLRPYNRHMSQHVLEIMRAHVDERGLAMPPSEKMHRRPRCMVYVAANAEQTRVADVLWKMVPTAANAHPCKVVEVPHNGINDDGFDEMISPLVPRGSTLAGSGPADNPADPEWVIT